MRYSTYNAIPQYPKSKKHPYETLENTGVPGFVLSFPLLNTTYFGLYQ